MTKEEITKRNYESFVANYPDGDFLDFEDKEMQGALSLVIYPAMQEYADQETAALRAENERLRGLIPDGFNIWLSNNGWLYHNSGDYYYKRGCDWPPKQNEMSDYTDLLKQFKTENNL